MQAINTAALDTIAARVMGTENPDMVGFLMFDWDAKNAAKEVTPHGQRKATQQPDSCPHVSQEPKPIFNLRKTAKAKVENIREMDRLARLEQLKQQYAENPSFEVEVPDHVQFGIKLAEAFRTHCKGEIPLFLLDEDTLFQVENEEADCRNLRDLL